METQGVFKKICQGRKMRIGIITFHRAHNYGAVLQCYALQETLKGMGHDVQVIDYRQPWIEDSYSLFCWNMIRRNSDSLSSLFYYLKGSLKKWMQAPRKSSDFRKFRERFLDMSAPCDDNIPQDYDCYLIGSDQLWSLHCLGGIADNVYMGRFERPFESTLVGYAISADMKSVMDSEELLKESVPAFDALSMRERQIADAVAEITGSSCEVCLDPTLLGGESLWEPLLTEVPEDEYVLMYEVRWNAGSKGKLRRKAEELAAAVGPHCKVIDLSRGDRPVEEFVSLFRNASHVVTTSFHGVVFSIIFGVPFYAFPLWGGYDLRYMDLLECVGAKDRVKSFDDELVPGPVDFTSLREKLSEEQARSVSFIERNLSK